MKRFKSILLSIICLCLSNSVFAFLPYIKNYSKTDFNAANQNWAVKQDSKGSIYIGNHKGLLEYNGCKWTLYPLPNTTVIRSLYIDKNDRIYAGSFGEFGYFERDHTNKLVYHSLTEKIDSKLLHNKQIWSIAQMGNKVLFQTFSGYFVYDGKQTVHHNVTSQMFLLNQVGEEVYTLCDGNLCHFQQDQIKPVKGVWDSSRHIKSILPFKKSSILLLTESDGIWQYENGVFRKWNNQIDDELKRANPNRGIITKDSLIIIGTILNGVYALNQEGKLVWHLNSGNGLQNNTILGIECDRENNIWLALDKGISFINNTSSMRLYKWNNKNIGFIYDIEPMNDKLYLATNQGLFYTDTLSLQNNTSQISFVQGTEGFIQDLYQTDGLLIISHSKKTMTLDKQNHLHKIIDQSGGMCTRAFTINNQPILVQSSYTTFKLFHKSPAGNWTLRNRLGGFNNPIQSFEIDHNGTIWAGHTNQGMYRIKTDPNGLKINSVTYYDSLDSLRSSKIGVFTVKNRLVFTDKKRCYTYDDLSDSIIPYALLNNHIGHYAQAHRIVPIDYNHYWFITDQDAAIVSLEGETPVIQSSITYQTYGFNMLDNFENIIPISTDWSYLCYENGIARLDNKKQNMHSLKSDRLYITEIYAYPATDRQAQTILPILEAQPTKISYDHNNLYFQIAYPYYSKTVRFNYKIEGLSEEWNSISSQGSIELTRLPVGKYTLHIHALDETDAVIAQTNYSFIVSPPWYRNPLAYIFYALILLALLYIIHYLTKRRLTIANKRLQEQQEREIVKLENEKLSNEITYKSKELAGSAMTIIQKDEILMTLKEEVQSQKELLGTHYPNKYYNRLLNLIESNFTSERSWEVFQANFDRIHENFFRHLNLQYPELTPSDLRLCALLRLNMSTKEMADLLNVTIRGVETRRYRLRKKLNLGPNDDLIEFMINFK